MATLVGIVSIVVNVAVSFMTDGNWKTAGTGLTQFYWNRAHQRHHTPLHASRPRNGKPFRLTWSAGTSGGRAEGLPAF
jgi:hypothetical protein